MRIGIDMLALQSPTSRMRGIGRYAQGFLSGLLAVSPEDHEFLFYAHKDLPIDLFPVAPNTRVKRLEPTVTSRDAIDRVARSNPDALDVLLILSPLEYYKSYSPPARPLGSLPIAAIVFDVIPFLFQERYLDYPPEAIRCYRTLERLRTYDALMAISEATAIDVRSLLGIPTERVVAIGSASDPSFFRPDDTGPLSEISLAVLRKYGINRPFVFCLAGTDERKNLSGLIDAFHQLPDPLQKCASISRRLCPGTQGNRSDTATGGKISNPRSACVDRRDRGRRPACAVPALSGFRVSVTL